MNVSIEVEYWVTDRNGRLASSGDLIDASQGTVEEFVEPMLELKTDACESIAELRTQFLERLDAVLSRADDLDKRLVPLGTPINCESVTRRSDERGRIQKQVVGSDFAQTKYCAGTHIHIEKRNVTDQLNTLIALDPALALVNSSPYVQGERVANGARAYWYRRQAYEEYPKHGQLWAYVENIGEWHRRLEHCYEEFEQAAIEAGVDKSAVADHFSPDDVVWTPIRLREAMPTVEWRSPDSALPSQLLRLTAQFRTVMNDLHHTNVQIEDESGDEPGRVGSDGITLPDFDTTCDLAEAAIHDGLENDTVAGYLDRMGFSVEDYHPISTRIDGRQYVPRSDARDLRLEYANALEADVDALLGAIEH